MAAAPSKPSTKLATYRKKRDFKQTPEPSGARSNTGAGARKGKSRALSFVVQLHRATRLHFDFRLEAGGTLKSWAVPKGPSMNTADKRLAMQVEDHPLDYGGFEGRIPKGNYGAGEVIVWDRGTYEPIEPGSAESHIAAGSLKFMLHGKKLNGTFALVKIRARDGAENAWLLIKERDQYASSAKNPTRDDRSVISKRTLDDIAANTRARTWISNRSASSKSHSSRGGKNAAPPADAKVELKRPEKVLFPQDKYTKADLAQYYDAVSRWMLPYLEDRPLSLERFPDGVGGPSFFEKNVPRGAPPWIQTVSVRGGEKRETVRYIVCNDRQTLAYLANLAAITLHVWTSHTNDLDRPDFVFFDLDPGERCTFGRLARVAVGLHDLLDGIGLATVLKTSGGSGLHVLIPLRVEYDYDLVRAFGQLIAQQMAEEFRDDVTLERSIAKRPKAAVYLDYVQIGRGKTMVAPYTVRARKGAPVSMPIAWAEIKKMVKSSAPDSTNFFAKWTIATVPAILRRRGNAWAGAFARPHKLEAAIKAARKAWGLGSRK